MNPAIDGHGISTSDECWEDEDFREGYFGGRYDVRCEECDGLRVVDEIDYERIDRETYEQYEAWCDEMYRTSQIEAGERMMGA